MKKIFIFLLLSSFTFNVFCQNTFSKLISIYGNNPNTSAISTSISSKSTGYIISGTIFDTLCNNYQSLYFYLSDSIGNLTKLHCFSQEGINYYPNNSSLIQTYDGGYCYASDMDDTSSISGNTFHFMIRFDSNMDTLWTKIIPHDTTWEAIRQIRETSDRGFIFVGSRNISPSDDLELMLIKTDSLGNQLWKKIIPMNYINGGTAVLETPDKGFLVKGYSESYTTGVGDPFLIKTDSAGIVIWYKYLGGNQYDGNGSMAITNEGDYLYAYGYSTYTYPFNESWSARLNIIKFSSDGTEIWNRMYDTIRNHLGVCKIQVFSNNDFIIMGNNALPTQGNNYSFFPTFLFKFNTNGDSLWRKIYFMADAYLDENFLADNVINADGGITACGWLSSDSQIPYQQIWILKTDSNGYAPGPQNVGIIDLPYLYVGYGELKVFPNPATTQATISYPLLTSQGQLQVYNTLGQMVYEETLDKNTMQTIINTKEYKRGLYKVVVSEKGEVRGQASLIIK